MYSFPYKKQEKECFDVLSKNPARETKQPQPIKTTPTPKTTGNPSKQPEI